MAQAQHYHSAFYAKARPVGQLALEELKHLSVTQSPRIFKRNQEDSSNKCTKNDKSALCGKPAETNNVTLPVVLGIVIPIGAALLLFFFLHRRHVRKLRQEDANDPHKSLDFGLEPSTGKKKSKAGARNNGGDPSTEKHAKHDHGMSMEIVNPYLLPPGLQSSRESLHSLSRTMHGGDDRYRPATTFLSNDSTSTRSHLDNRNRADDSSSFAGSGSSGNGYGNDKMNQSLLKNAQRMSTSLPLMQNISLSGGGKTLGSPSETEIKPARQPNLSPAVPTDTRESYIAYPGSVLRKSSNYLGLLIDSGDPSASTTRQTSKQPSAEQSKTSSAEHQQISSRKSPPPILSAGFGSVRPPRLQSLNAPTTPQDQSISLDDGSHEREILKAIPTFPEQPGDVQRNEVGRRPDQERVPPPDDRKIGVLEIPSPAFDVRRLSMGFRPLPPDDPSDNPEQRAIRIRSFYKEYFDDTKPGSGRTPGDYFEDNQQGYFGGGAYHNSPTRSHFGSFQAPFAQPPTRRAMTPPPRASSRFQGPARHQASFSGGGFAPRGVRSFSSASDRFGFPARGSSRPPLPPPGPLRILPSPHLINEDSFGLPIDFAPPISYKDRQAGRPDSPKGGMRPYSPMLPAHIPLASSFDDLSVMPSPHSLRKSGTYTALDFAPPPRFKNSDNGSDSGSIRSNRSAMSAQQLHNIRAGAYRVSRIPKEVVGTRNEINDSLKPQWGIRP